MTHIYLVVPCLLLADWLHWTFDLFLGVIGGALPLLTSFQGTILLSDVISQFPTYHCGSQNQSVSHSQPDMVYLLLKKPLINVFLVKYLMGLPIHPTICRYLILTTLKQPLKKSTLKRFLILSPSPSPCPHTLVRQFNHWMQPLAERNHFLPVAS